MNGFVQQVDTTQASKSSSGGKNRIEDNKERGVEIGLLTQSEINRIKEICKDFDEPEGDTYSYTDNNGNRKVVYAYNPDFLPKALLTVLEGRLLILNGYSYNDWIDGNYDKEKLYAEVKKIITRNCIESKFVKDFCERSAYTRSGNYRGARRWEEDIDRCLNSLKVPVLIDISHENTKEIE